MTNRLMAIIFAFLIVLTGSATAQNTYGVFGITSFSQKPAAFPNNARGQKDVKGNGPSFGVGYHILDILSAEISFSNLEYEDEYTEDIERIDDSVEGTISVSGDVEVIDFSLLIRRQTDIPRPYISPYLMVGFMDFNASDSATNVHYPRDVPSSYRRVGIDQAENYFGFGIDLLPEKNGLGFRLHYKVIGGDIDADFFSAGLIFDF